MQLFTTIAVILPLVASTLGQRAFKKTNCVWYDPANLDKVVWQDNGPLNQDASKPGELDKWAWKDISQDRSLGMQTNYRYTVHGGIGKFEPGLDAVVIYAQADRTAGKGLGQQFKVNFNGVDGKTLRSYWVMPQERCTASTDLTVAQIKSITYSSVVY